MHPKIILYLNLTEEQSKKIDELCQLMHKEAAIYNDIVLNYLEFSDMQNTENELLLLEIANETLSFELGKTVAKLELIKYELENIKQAIHNLI